jgi:hypothetical protein
MVFLLVKNWLDTCSPQYWRGRTDRIPVLPASCKTALNLEALKTNFPLFPEFDTFSGTICALPGRI